MRIAAALAAVALVSCVPRAPEPVDLADAEALLKAGEAAQAAAEFRRLLGEIDARESDDYQAQMGRLRIHFHLFDHRAKFEGLPEGERGAYRSAREHLTLAARAAVRVLSGAAPKDCRKEACCAAARAFVLKARDPSLRMCDDCGEVGRYLLLRVAECFRSASGEENEACGAADVARELAADGGASPAFREVWGGFAARKTGEGDRRFAQLSLARHLQEGTRAQDIGTRERAAQGDVRQILRHYVEALAHFTLVRECTVEPTVSEENALGAMEAIVSYVVRLRTR